MLLSVAKYPPHKVGDCYFLRDIIAVYFDLRVSWWQACINGDTIRGGKDIKSYQDFLQEIATEIDAKNRSGQHRRACIFINDLDVTRVICPEGDLQKSKKKKMGFSYSIEYLTQYFRFNNFNVIFNSKAEKCARLFPGVPLCKAMCNFLLMFDLPVHKIRYSLAYITKKVFYQDIRSELWEDTVQTHRMIKYKKLYDDMQAGNQGGAISNISNIFEILLNVASYDKKSAYPSYFISDRYFPVGEIYEVRWAEKVKLDALRVAMASGLWYKIVIEPPQEIQQLSFCKSPGVLQYGVEFWDGMLLKKCGVDIFKLLHGVPFRLYRTEITGYMPRCFRDKIMQIYAKKEEIADKSSPQRYLLKTQLDMIYGKGLQKFDFEKDEDVFKKYVCRGENFLNPAMSMHVVSAMRHEIMTIISHFKGGCIAFDTDGVRLALDKIGAEQARDFFENINAYIIAKNRRAGYDTNIGIWDHEYTAEKYMQFAPKVYAYQECDKITAKFAGVPERRLKKYLRGIAPENAFEVWQRDGINIKIGAGWIYLPDLGGFIETESDYIIKNGGLKKYV